MKKLFIGIIFFSSFLLSINNCFSKNIHFSLFGSSIDPDAPEFASFLYQVACVKENPSWETLALGFPNKNGFRGNTPSNTYKDLNNLLNSETKKNYFEFNKDFSKLKAKGKNDFQSIEKKTTQFIIDEINKASKGLQKGDQFMLNIKTHGASNCLVQNQNNIGLGIGKFQDCNHYFIVSMPGLNDEYKISTKDLIAGLKPLKSRGVKVAVDIYSCFGGAAIKDFAREGICAHAYASPNTVLKGCGGKEKADYRMTGDSFALSSCRTKDDEQFEELTNKLKFPREEDPFGSGKMKPYMRFQCAKETIKELRETLKGKNQTLNLSDLFNSLREKDEETNMPIGTSGPFWITGNMGFLGASGAPDPSLGNINIPDQSCFKNEVSAKNYIGHHFLKSIGKINECFTGEACNMNETIYSFTIENKKILDEYLRQFKKTSDKIKNTNDMIRKYISEESIREINNCLFDKLQEDLAKNSGLKDDPSSTHNAFSKELYAPDSLVAIKTWIDSHGYGSTYQKTCYEKYKNILSQKNVDENNFTNEYKNAQYEEEYEREALRQLNLKKIIPLERMLYKKMLLSKEYQECLNLNPKLKEAKDACDSFQAP